MIGMTVSVDGLDQSLIGFGEMEKQLPFAMAKGINLTLDDAQGAIRKEIHSGPFHLRRPEFIDRTIYIGRDDRARKDRLSGTVRVNPERDFLAKFEDGGTKAPTQAKSLAIPVFREQAPNLIIRKGDAMSVGNLLRAIDAAKQGKPKSFGNRKRLRRQSLYANVNGKRVFILKAKSGATLIAERTSKGTWGSFGGARVLWAFRPSVPIEALLHFGETALETAEARWEINMGEALELALATAR